MRFNMIIVAILALRFSVKLRFLSNTSIPFFPFFFLSLLLPTFSVSFLFRLCSAFSFSSPFVPSREASFLRSCFMHFFIFDIYLVAIIYQCKTHHFDQHPSLGKLLLAQTNFNQALNLFLPSSCRINRVSYKIVAYLCGFCGGYEKLRCPLDVLSHDIRHLMDNVAFRIAELLFGAN